MAIERMFMCACRVLRSSPAHTRSHGTVRRDVVADSISPDLQELAGRPGDALRPARACRRST